MRSSVRQNPKKKSTAPFVPPTFEPIEKGPQGTWYRAADGQVEIGARLSRGIPFVTAWFSVVALVVFCVFLFTMAEEEIEPLWVFILGMSAFTSIPLGFALYYSGAVVMKFEGDSVEFQRGVLFFKRRKRFRLKELTKVRLIPRTTTYTYITDDDVSVAEIDFSKGAGVTMEFAIETKDLEYTIASDLSLERTFYLRYGLMKARKGELPIGQSKAAVAATTQGAEA